MDNISKKIVAIDDDTTILEYLKMALTNLGYEFFGYDSAERGIDAVEKEKPALILLDVMLPDMDGLTVCRKLKSKPSVANVPIIMLTSLTDAATIQNAHLYGAVDFLPKPFELQVLKSKIEKALSKRPKA